MAPVDDNPNELEEVMQHIKAFFTWFATFSGLIVPALAGAVVGAFKQNRRNIGWRKLLVSVFMSAACGCGLTPLFAHMLGMPEPIAASLAFFLGVWGLEGIEVVQYVLRSRLGDNRERHGAGGDR